jgi:hypothetical protein
MEQDARNRLDVGSRQEPTFAIVPANGSLVPNPAIAPDRCKMNEEQPLGRLDRG